MHEEKEIRRYLRHRFSPMCWFLLGYFLIINVCVIGALVLQNMFSNPTVEELNGNAWGYLLACAIGMVILLCWKKIPFWRDRVWARREPMTIKNFILLLVLTIGCQMAASLYGIVLELILNMFGTSAVASIESATAGADTISMFLYAGLAAPVVEELVFRGFVQETLKPYGKKFAILGSALLFGLFHGNLFQTPYAILVGLVLGYVAAEYSIGWAMLLHMINNLVLGDTISRLTAYLPDLAQSMIALAITFGCGIASAVILGTHSWEIRQYLRTSPMDKRCVRCFFLNGGFIAFTLLMVGEMILRFL